MLFRLTLLVFVAAVACAIPANRIIGAPVSPLYSRKLQAIHTDVDVEELVADPSTSSSTPITNTTTSSTATPSNTSSTTSTSAVSNATLPSTPSSPPSSSPSTTPTSPPSTARPTTTRTSTSQPPSTTAFAGSTPQHPASCDFSPDLAALACRDREAFLSEFPSVQSISWPSTDCFRELSDPLHVSVPGCTRSLCLCTNQAGSQSETRASGIVAAAVVGMSLRVEFTPHASVVGMSVQIADELNYPQTGVVGVVCGTSDDLELPPIMHEVDKEGSFIGFKKIAAESIHVCLITPPESRRLIVLGMISDTGNGEAREKKDNMGVYAGSGVLSLVGIILIILALQATRKMSRRRGTSDITESLMKS